MNEDKILESIAYHTDQISYEIRFYAGMVLGVIGILVIFVTIGTFVSMIGGALSISSFLWALRNARLGNADTRRYYEKELMKVRSDQD